MQLPVLLAVLSTSALALPGSSLRLGRRRGPTDTLGDYTGSTSKYPDGSGTYVRSDDDYSYPGSSDHCWTDTFYVDSTPKAEDWGRTDNAEIDCKTTSVCDAGSVNSKQRCTTWTLTASYQIGIAASITATAGGQTQIAQQQCSTATTQATCHWNDTMCHATWTSDVTHTVHGYLRRRCNQGGHNEQTVWARDFDINTPATSTRLGCAASCTDQFYPDPVPII